MIDFEPHTDRAQHAACGRDDAAAELPLHPLREEWTSDADDERISLEGERRAVAEPVFDVAISELACQREGEAVERSPIEVSLFGSGRRCPAIGRIRIGRIRTGGTLIGAKRLQSTRFEDAMIVIKNPRARLGGAGLAG